MNKLASLTGYTPGSAAFTMGKIKRKLKNKTAGISSDSPAVKSRPGRPRTATATAPSTSKKRGTTAAAAPAAAKRPRKGAIPHEPTSSPSEHLFNADDDEEDFSLGIKIKKEEPVFKHEERGASAASYGFLDGIETFRGAGAGMGRSAATGYRAPFVESAE
jgi:hypothetical protein